MSPASQGVLEVERYIGSCLISSNVRAGLHGKPVACRKQEQSAIRGKARGCYNNGQAYPLGDQQNQVQYGPGGWTGAPLISMTSSPRRCNQRSSPSLGQQQQQTCTDQQQQQQQQQQVPPVGGHLPKNPLSRLAIHTQGAPLILAGRFYNRGKVHNSSAGGTNNTVCGNITGNYVHNNSGNPSMTSNAASKCPTSQMPAQRSVEVMPKKAPTTNPKPNADCSAAGKENAGSSSIANIDSLSIASDESTGSNNSENSLPRIIKPRKRRKKDRKPPNNIVELSKSEEPQQRQQPSGCGIGTGDQLSVVTVKSYASTCHEPRVYEAAPPHLRNYRRPPVGHRENVYGGCRAPSMQEVTDVRQRYAHRHMQVKVLFENRNVAPMRVALPKGYRHHVGGNGNCSSNNNSNNNNNNNLPRRYIHEYGDAVNCEAAVRDDLGPCQCRYCDPSGLIWDVDQNGYSPFLTAPPGVEYCRGQFGQMPMFLSPPDIQERALDRLFDEHSRTHHDGRDTEPAGPGGAVLRRSWSDPTSYFSYDEIAAPTRDVGVIGDRGQSDGGKRRTLWRGDTYGASANSSANSVTSPHAGGVAAPKGLEVSTEIITSPNGHRDLEIKFYSSASPVASAEREEDKSSCLHEEADDDEEDDFSDIWSYHESKLQQDFRTLLQAEE